MRTWLTPADWEILDFLSQYPDIAAPPKTWHVNMPEDERPTYVHVKNRLGTLRDIDEPIVEQDPERNDGYTITEFGLDVVNGEVSVERINELDPNDDEDEEDDEDDDS